MAKPICYRRTLILWIFISSLFLSHITFGQLYVGQDNNQTTQVNAQLFGSITEAFKAASPGDTIFLVPGRHAKIFLNNIHGLPEKPIVLTSYSKKNRAIIDGGSKPGNGLKKNGITLNNCSWLVFDNINFENCWTDIVVALKSSYISFANCHFIGGRRAISPIGKKSHHFLIENSYWEQHPEVWLTDTTKWNSTKAWWTSMHHEEHRYYNGALFHPVGSAGGFVIRGNIIKNVFNGFRTKPGSIAEDGNGEIYNNSFINIRDNEFEPERWAWNIHFYHNEIINSHRSFSIDGTKGGHIYIYGNTITQDHDPYTEEIVSGIWKYKLNPNMSDGGLSYPCYAFNNSFYASRAFDMNTPGNYNLVHFNNAYQFFIEPTNGDRTGFLTTNWDTTYVLDYDISNLPWGENVLRFNHEKNGIIANPKFINPLKGDFRLSEESPAIDAGKVIRFDSLDWQMTYVGKAPDMGAYENAELVEGPPYKHLEAPGGSLYKEKPRISRHYIKNDTLSLFFSLELTNASFGDNMISIYSGEKKIEVINIHHPPNSRILNIITKESLDKQPISIWFNQLPVGTNGKTATHWASTIPIRWRE